MFALSQQLLGRMLADFVCCLVRQEIDHSSFAQRMAVDVLAW
jgi:hypothetical protein